MRQAQPDNQKLPVNVNKQLISHCFELLLVGELIDDHVGAVIHSGDRHMVPPRYLPGDLVSQCVVHDVRQPGVGVK